jgi:hypothetical protein
MVPPQRGQSNVTRRFEVDFVAKGGPEQPGLSAHKGTLARRRGPLRQQRGNRAVADLLRLSPERSATNRESHGDVLRDGRLVLVGHARDATIVRA